MPEKEARDNGIQFAELPRNRNTAYSRRMRFDMICEENGFEHRLTKPNHPWTNGALSAIACRAAGRADEPND
jgi:hypothetical protein